MITKLIVTYGRRFANAGPDNFIPGTEKRLSMTAAEIYQAEKL